MIPLGLKHHGWGVQVIPIMPMPIQPNTAQFFTPFIALSGRMFWALRRWSRMYSISPPRLKNRIGRVRKDIAGAGAGLSCLAEHLSQVLNFSLR